MKRMNFRSPVMISLYIVLALLLAVYIGFVIFFSSHYLPNTIVGNTACGWKSPEYLESVHEKRTDGYVLSITDRAGETFLLRGSTFSYTYVKQGEEQKILDSQNPFTWFIAFFQEHTYTLSASVTYDKEAAQKAISSLDLFHEEYIQAPQDAYLQMTETGYEIVPEVMGTTPALEPLTAFVMDAMNQQQTSLTLSDDCYINPEQSTTSEKIVSTAQKLDAYLASTITYEIEGYEEDLSKEEIAKMLILGEDYSITINTQQIDKFVQSLASKYNTYGDKREFMTSKGDVITVGGGDYGWVINKKKEAAQILSDLEGGTAVSREPIYEQRALYGGLDDIGNTYIEVDYTSQHMWVYKDGEMILESDFVSGDMSENNGSPDGVFKIVYKDRDAILRGEDYESAVSYFMPFAYNVGFHDATWRKKFGGEIYKTNGSHGCINLPPDFAKTLYENVATGTPVIAYYREPIILTSENARISNAFSYKKTS